MKKYLKNNAILLLFLVAALSVMIISLYTRDMAVQTLHMLEDNIEQRMLALSRAAARLVPASELAQYQAPEDMEEPGYTRLKNQLASFTEESGITYTYYLRPAEEGMLQFVVDNDFDPETQVNLVTPTVAVEPAPALALQGEAASAGLGSYSVNWDGMVSAYAPVYDEAGQVYCIAGVDMVDEHIVNTRSNINTLTLVMVISSLAAIGSGALGFSLYRSQAEKAQSASVAKSDFLSRMSHEIRTPLNAIIGLSRMAEKADDIPAMKNYLTSIRISSGHLLDLVNDVLDLSKIESGTLSLEEAPVSPQNETNSIYHMILPQAAEKNQKLEMQIDKDMAPYVYSDASHVRQILVNLLSNAVKFTPEGGEIFYTTRQIGQKGDQVHLQWSIRDNGIGIAPEELETIFAPFEQADGGSTRKFGGTGLGLAITRELVRAMNGNLRVKSEKGQGSEFIVDMWLRAAPSPEASAPDPAEGDAPSLTGMQILLVEDSEINQIVAEDVIASMGAAVDFAGNGAEGLEKYLQNPDRYQIIFMDIQMPVMDGYEATRLIRASEKPGAETIPIIAMTANVFKEDIERALASGMNAHIGKPFEVAQVRKTVAEVLAAQGGADSQGNQVPGH